MELIRFNKACVHFRLADVEGCPYAVCLKTKTHNVSPDVVACQFSMSCLEYQRPGSDPTEAPQDATGRADPIKEG